MLPTAVRYGPPGSWMYHCHILDHADGGLMGMVEVGDFDRQPVEHKHHESP